MLHGMNTSMDISPDPSAQRAVRELVARFAAQFSEAALADLAARLLRAEATRDRWEVLVGEVVACAVYNEITLSEAEGIVLRGPSQSEQALSPAAPRPSIGARHA
jgi:hypothetical protein